MDLYLVPNNPEHALFVSPNGVAHYQVQTIKLQNGNPVTVIQRPGASPEDRIVAEIEWKKPDTPTIIRSPMFSGVGQCVGTQGIGIQALNYLYKRYRFGPAWYFIGDDAVEYRWKIVRGSGCVLARYESNTEVASSMDMLVREGLFAGEKKHTLRIQPCSLDIDAIILTFVIMETKRRKRGGFETGEVYDEDPQGDGGGSGEGEAEAGMVGEL